MSPLRARPARRRRLRLAAAFCAGIAGTWSVAVAHADPRIDYMLHCRGCHGPDGRGVADAAPSLHAQPARFLRLPGGRAYLVRVPGVAQSGLSDTDLAALLNWLLHRFSAEALPRDFVPYSAAEVARYRAAPLDDVSRTRRALLRGTAAIP